MSKIFQTILAALARSIIKKYRPEIIAITGSVGKTSTKDAVVAVLDQKFRVRGSAKNYNNELGVPLTIIGALTPGRSIIAWCGLFLKGINLLVSRVRYPDVLVLEMAADHPGDLLKLARIARPNVALVTAVSEAHTEFFGDTRAVQKEKASIVRELLHGGVAILNADDPLVASMAELTAERVVLYGFGESADFWITNYAIHSAPLSPIDSIGVECLIEDRASKSSLPIRVSGVVGKQTTFAVAAAIAAGRAYALTADEIMKGITTYRPPSGRMRVIAGIKRSILIDDTYNSSPRAATEALEALRMVEVFGESRRVAVLGDMLELGSLAEASHREVGKKCAELNLELLVTVGELSRDTARAAREAGMPAERVFEFTDRVEAGTFTQDRIMPGDVILIKGSQGMRMEYVVKELMAEPLRAAELLVRQDPSWVR